ncbi:hypothetical protein [Streptomyces pacificus]|uniref:Helix-turn-helix domain-containing protein n=1 Tax=Streptomyces pacificus TaxID=2705029 RepID=A0A6A0B2C4_9ACTN|nr:hypothetical protein [Streptomyces pacificus]GFH39236.1 helix-turn-helix domain-containing protein [Streptomyces pacificus]
MMKQSAAILQPPGRAEGADHGIDADFTPKDLGHPQSGTSPSASAPVRRGRVKVPMRLVESSHYSDAALSVYVKVKALSARAAGCTAAAGTLASYIRLSEATVHRGLAQLRDTAPDGVVELPDNQRRSLSGGSGTTACRRVRPLKPTERYVWLAVVASEQMRPRLLRAYAVIAYAVVQGIPLSEGDLASFLCHHSGPRAGKPVSTEAASRIIDELAAAGWISVRRRAGFQGRHLFVVHDSPCAATPQPDDRSGPDADASSLAYKEDLRIDRPENEGLPLPSAVGEVTVVAAATGRTDEPAPADAPAGLALRAEATTPAPKPTAPSTAQTSWTGPQLTFSPRLDFVLEPVRFLLCQANTYVQRRIGREVSRQLEDGCGPSRLRARLTQRLTLTFIDDIRDPGRWLLGVALPRWGCANPDCESGVLWSTGTSCAICREVVAERAAARRRRAAESSCSDTHTPDHRSTPRPAAVRRITECCPDCERPHLPGGTGLCAECRARTASPSAASPVTATTVPAGSACRGRNGSCGRPAPHGLCWRCRTESEARSTGERLALPTTHVPEHRREKPCVSPNPAGPAVHRYGRPTSAGSRLIRPCTAGADSSSASS